MHGMICLHGMMCMHGMICLHGMIPRFDSKRKEPCHDIFTDLHLPRCAVYVSDAPQNPPRRQLPLSRHIFAHRGLHDNNHQIPENSLAAFQRAVDAGYGIELDVQLSADRIPVVFHDATLSRMCGIDRRVDELTFAELRQLCLANTQEQIPSFQEALALVNGKVPLLVELKMERLDFDIPREADALLSEYSGDYCIESFHPAALYWYRKTARRFSAGSFPPISILKITL